MQVNDVAEGIAQHLDFDMAWLFDEFFDEHALVAKAVARLVAARLEAFGRLFVVEGHAQAFAAAARTGLDHHGIANALGNFHGLLGRLDRIVVARNGVDLGLQRQFFGGNLVAHCRNGGVLGADEYQPLFFHALGKGFVFGQKAVTGVNGLRTRLLGCGNDLVSHQIRLARGRRPQQHGLVGHLHVAGIAVGFGIHRHGGNAHFLGRGDDAAGDLATVGNQNFREHMQRPFQLITGIEAAKSPARATHTRRFGETVFSPRFAIRILVNMMISFFPIKCVCLLSTKPYAAR